jgi:hypothetical protein
VVKRLRNNAQMLYDYFAVEIDDDGNLHTIPELLDGYVPNLGN